MNKSLIWHYSFGHVPFKSSFLRIFFSYTIPELVIYCDYASYDQYLLYAIKDSGFLFEK